MQHNGNFAVCMYKDPKIPPIKRHASDADFKLKAISHALEHGNRAAVREFNINESIVRNWRKQEDNLRQVKKTKKSFQGSQMATVRGQNIEQRTAGRSLYLTQGNSSSK